MTVQAIDGNKGFIGSLLATDKVSEGNNTVGNSWQDKYGNKNLFTVAAEFEAAQAYNGNCVRQ